MSDLFDNIWDWVSGGQVSRNQQEEMRLSALHGRLETLTKNYNYWYLQETILSKALYQITILAFNDVCKIQDIIKHLSVKQRNIVEHSLQTSKYDLKDIEQTLAILSTISFHSGKIMDTRQFAQDTLDGNLAILKELPNGVGFASAGVYTLISGLEHYATLNSQFNELKAGQYEALEKIDNLESRLFKLKAQVHRADEMGVSIGKGVFAFKHCFVDVYNKLFPNGEKSKQERENRATSGGNYFLDSEKQEVKSLLETAGYVLKMVEAKP
jgi:hypothetical protein